MLGLQVWRPVGGNEFTLICENEFAADDAGSIVHQEVDDADSCLFAAGDSVGWYHAGQGVTDYDNGGHAVKWNYPMDHPGVGNNVVFTGGGSRTYSVAASVIYALGSELIRELSA